MSKSEELHKEIHNIWLIYNQARLSFEIYKYIVINPIESHFWRHIQYISIKDCYIELDKLLNASNNQKLNLNKFMKKLSKSGYYSSLKFDENKLSEWINELLKFEELKLLIQIARDHHFAHTEPNPQKRLFELRINNYEIEKLFKFIEYIIKDVLLSIGSDADTALLFNSESLKDIKILNEYYENYSKKVIEKLIKSSERKE